MKKVFISQPMRGLTDEEILEKRSEIKKDIQLLSQADMIYLGEGWDKARGCKIEYEIAKAYGINIIGC